VLPRFRAKMGRPLEVYFLRGWRYVFFTDGCCPLRDNPLTMLFL